LTSEEEIKDYFVKVKKVLENEIEKFEEEKAEWEKQREETQRTNSLPTPKRIYKIELYLPAEIIKAVVDMIEYMQDKHGVN
jgi:NADH:ubiquinone oxidoreductase subunit E